MKSIRDVANKMPETRSELEEKVISYSPSVRRALEANPTYRALLEKEVDRSFERYGRYLGGLTHKLSSAGHAVGYAADAWLATGDIVGSLGGNFIDLLAQIPEKAYGLFVYAPKTGNYMDALQNVFEGAISYLPGFTIADQGLSRIIQKRMIKDVTYNVEKALGQYKPWNTKVAEQNQNYYSDVSDRKDNIIKIPRGERRLAA